MTNQELLAELRENILRDKSGLITGAQDSLWSDTTLLRYINDAQRQLARRTLIIRDDSTAAVTQITLQTGVPEYALHSSVRAVISARWNTDAFDLARAGHALLSRAAPLDMPWWDVNQATVVQPGRPRAFDTDEGTAGPQNSRVKLRIFPPPDATVANNTIIYLRVARMPLTRINQDSLAKECEIPEDYHLDMLNWPAYKALSNQDADRGDPERAKECHDAFMDMILEINTEMRRRMFVPLTWQFGNGWNWASDNGAQQL